MKKALVFTLLLTTCLNANFWSGFAEIDGRSNGYRRGTGLYLFAPLYENNQTLFFSQGLGGRFYDVWMGSVGVGYRGLRHDTWIEGVNGFIDIGLTDRSRIYVQGGIGAEAFWESFTARANGYFSISSPRMFEEGTFGDGECLLIGTELFTEGGGTITRERICRGGDFEVGHVWDIGNSGGLWVYAGGFVYGRKEEPSLFGPRARIEYRYEPPSWGGAEFIGRAEYEYNRVDRNYGSIYLGLRIPLYGGSVRGLAQSSLYRRMGDRVQRAEGILLCESMMADDTRGGGRQQLFSPDGNPLHVWFVENAGIGDGSLASPANFMFVEANSLTYDFIILLNTNGIIDLGNNDFDIKFAQSLFGLGDDGAVEINADDCSLVITEASGRAVVTRQGIGSAIHLTDQNHTMGYDIDITNIGILGTNAGGDFLIEDVNISNATARGIQLPNTPGSNIIRDLDITDVGNDAIFMSGGPTGVQISAVNITNATGGGDGIGISGGPTDVTIGPLVSIENVEGQGIQLSGTAVNTTISGVTIDTTGLNGILSSNMTETMLIEDVTLTNISPAGSSAAIALAVNNDVTIQRTDILNFRGEGISMTGGTATASISEVTIDGGALTGDTGISIAGASTDLTIGPMVEISNLDGAADGILIAGAPGITMNTVISGVTITNIGASGIQGINLVNTLIEDVTLQDISAPPQNQAAIAISNGSMMTTIQRVTIEDIGHDGISISGGPTDLTITEVTIDGGIFAADAAVGINIAGASDEVTIGPMVEISNFANDGIQITGSPGVATNTIIQDVDITTIEQSGIQCVNVDGILIDDAVLMDISQNENQPAFSFSGVTLSDITIQNSSATEFGHNGIAMSGATDVTISNVDLVNVTTLDNNGDGISILGGSDGIDIDDVTITNVGMGADAGIRITGSNTDINNVTLTDIGMQGIIVMSGANATINDATITRAPGDGIFLGDISGDLVLTNSTLTDTATINGNAAIDVMLDGVTTDFTVTGNTVTSDMLLTEDGIDFLIEGGADVTGTISGNTVDTLNHSALEFDQMDAGGSICLRVENNMFLNSAGAVASPMVTMQQFPNTDGSSFCFHFTGNEIMTTGNRGILLQANSTGATASTFSGFIEDNDIDATTDEAIFVQTDLENAAHLCALDIRDNRITNAVAQAIRYNANTTSLGTVNLTIEDNTDTGSGSGDPAYEFDSAATFSGDACLTVRGNNTDRGNANDIEVDFLSGPAFVEMTDFPNLSANNNGISVNTINAPGDTPDDCDLPPDCGCP